LVGSLIYDGFSVTRLYSVDDRVISKLLIGKDFAGSGRGLILRYYPSIRLEGQRKITKKLSRSSGPKFEPRTSQIRSRSVNNLTTTFGRKRFCNMLLQTCVTCFPKYVQCLIY
jgi:hypothetical protein